MARFINCEAIEALRAIYLTEYSLPLDMRNLRKLAKLLLPYKRAQRSRSIKRSSKQSAF
jgi:hypothetical protein